MAILPLCKALSTLLLNNPEDKPDVPGHEFKEQMRWQFKGELDLRFHIIDSETEP